jgi:hypothetical protein
MTYYSIAVQFEKGDKFSLQFGDYDREVVVQEIEDSYADAHKVRIIRSGDTTDQINAAINKLNEA